MPLGSQIAVDPTTSGTPQNVAAETISTKQYQGVLLADASGNILGVSTNPLEARQSDVGPVTGTLTAQQLTTAATAAGSAVQIDLAGAASVAVEITGTFSANFMFQVSIDGTNWTQKTGTNQAGFSTNSGGAATTASFAVGGFRYFRVVCNVYTSGTVSVLLRGGANPSAVHLANGIMGDITHDNVNSTTVLPTGAHAVDPRVGQTAVQAADRVRVVSDPQGQLLVRQREVTSHSAHYRLAARPYPLSFVFTANTRKQFATLFHAASATKVLRLNRVLVSIRSISIAAIVTVDLVRLTNAVTPATGNPAVTPTQHHASDPAAEATALSLPTTAGTEFANSILNSLTFETAAVTPAIGSTAPPTLTSSWQTLYRSELTLGDDAPAIPLGVAGGFAVILDCNAAATVTATLEMDFSEETY